MTIFQKIMTLKIPEWQSGLIGLPGIRFLSRNMQKHFQKLVVTTSLVVPCIQH